MTTAITKTNGHLDPAIIESLVLGGDVGKLTPAQKVQYVGYRCKQLGLDPAAQPFQLLRLQGKEVLYATAAATQQLCQSRGLSVQITKREVLDGIYCVEARVSDKDGRFTENMGTVPLEGLKGEVRSNAMLKCTTKAIRRTVLAHCGLGVMDETEVETIPGAQPQGRGNPLRQEFAALSYELDACKSQEQIDLLLESPEFLDFEKRDSQQSSGMSFAGMMRDRADQMKKKLPERIRYEGNKIVATTHAEAEFTNAGASSPDATPAQPAVVPPSSNSAEPESSPDERDDWLTEATSKFLDRIDVAETLDELEIIKADMRKTVVQETEKPMLNKAYSQRKKTIMAKTELTP